MWGGSVKGHGFQIVRIQITPLCLLSQENLIIVGAPEGSFSLNYILFLLVIVCEQISKSLCL
jgi:hypothetical protein